MGYFDCANVPPRCKATPWLTADYVLSTYYNELLTYNAKEGIRSNALEECYFNGTAIFASAAYLYADFFSDIDCVVSQDPFATPLDNQGYATIKRQSAPTV